MAALGRILQVIGWLWLAASVLSAFVAIPDVGIFPGIILIFVARVLRRNARRREVPTTDEEEEPRETPRMLNTEKARPPETTPVRTPARSAPNPASESPPEERSELLREVLAAGEEVAEESAGPRALGGIDADEVRRPMSSAEMLARAHQRWDRRR